MSTTAQVEASRVAHEEETMPEALVWGNMVEMSSMMGATGASVSLHADGGQANEVRPRFVGASGRVALTFGFLRGPDSSPSWKATVGDTLSSPRCFDVVALEMRSWGCRDSPECPSCLLDGGKWQRVWSWHAHSL
jgi:hypothetical protein